MFYNDLNLVGRSRSLFENDYATAQNNLWHFFKGARVLVAGGAGSIGAEVVKLVAAFPVAALHVIDLSENNLTELTRDFRSSIGYIEAETKFLPLDIASPVFDAYLGAQGAFDIILNFTAMKHVRSEKDPWSLMRMIDTNIFAARKLADYAGRARAKKYFCVSTDKAQKPANVMGATKRVMECYLAHVSVPVSTARFANVAFSDGSLLHGFLQRLEKRQPLSAPSDVRRYFVTGEEAGKLCIASIGLGRDKEIFFPKLDAEKETTTFSEIARRFLELHDFEMLECGSEDEARAAMAFAPQKGQWPCHVFKSDTTGEKPLEEFYGSGDKINTTRFADIGVIEGLPQVSEDVLQGFENKISALKSKGAWTKPELVSAIESALPDFQHEEKGKFLDERM